MTKKFICTIVGKLAKARKSAVSAAVAAAMGLSLPFGAAQASGVPTVDIAAITQMLQQYLVLMNQLQQLENTVSQLEHTQSFFEATTTGMRAFAQANSTLSMLDFIPANMGETLSAMRGGSFGSLPIQAQSIMNQMGASERCAQSSQSGQLACMKRYAITAMEISSFMAGQQVAMQRREAITGMLSSIQSTTDPKGIADMQARIQQESASIQNEMARIEMASRQLQAERMAAEEEARYASRRYTFGDGTAPTF